MTCQCSPILPHEAHDAEGNLVGVHPISPPRRALEDTPATLPVTKLGEIAEMVREAQRSIRLANFHFEDASLDEANDTLAQVRILIDVLRGGPDG